MSRVFFHSPSGTAELRGSERAYADHVASAISNELAVPSMYGIDRPETGTLSLIPQDHYLRRMMGVPGRGFEEGFRIAWRVGFSGVLQSWRGHTIDTFEVRMNSALLLGSDQVAFLAKLHGTCEIHGWFDGPDRAWVADLMARGREQGIYRPDQGWEEVIELLRSRDDEPVVMSFSVTESFPSPRVSDYLPPWPEGVPRRYDALSPEQQTERDEAEEAWGDLPEAERWDLSMTWLRDPANRMPSITPDTLRDLFGHCITIVDLIADDMDERLAERFKVDAPAVV